MLAGLPSWTWATSVEFRFRPETRPNQVYLAGSFNNWNATGDLMTDPDGDGVYTVALELDDGRYEYKFVADGSWITDLSAVDFHDDGFGGKNSVIYVGIEPPAGAGVGAEGGATGGGATGGESESAPATAAGTGGTPVDVLFRYQPVISGDRDVFVAGSFNGWVADRDRMEDPEGDGVFEITLPLAPGRYEYKYVVQGTWMTDENAEDFSDDGFGGKNSVLYVGEAARPMEAEGIFNVTFTHTPGSKPNTIVLAGTFNDWSTGATSMTDLDGDGTYEVTLVLPGGEYQYKFVVDGTWTTDMKAESFADDGFGGKNSVIRVDARLAAVDMEVGDGEIFTDGISHTGNLAERNILSDQLVTIRTKAYKNDIEDVTLIWRSGGGAWRTVPFTAFSDDVSMDHLEANIESVEPLGDVEYGMVYEDGDTALWLGEDGFSSSPSQDRGETALPPAPEGFRYFSFDPATAPRFDTPAWVRDGIFYQIFPDRFRNGDASNDPDFGEWYYEGKARLPRVGKFNGEYYHFVKDWYDIEGLKESPYRDDGRPDYFSFYGGDIAGIRQKLDYLQDLGITIIYFNPVFEAKSNHRYDAASYERIDPKLGTNEEFRRFVDEAHARGIRIIIDTVFNHTGNSHWAFKDCVEKGEESEYWSWYEWKKWPLPKDNATFKAEDYYECWWGFGDLPDVNFDLRNPKTIENGIVDIADAEPNQAVADYLLESTRFWLTELDVDGLRLDVPNEVPLWFWRIFAQEVKAAKPDAYIVAELWGDASATIGPGMFDATMNYRYFRDPVTKWIAQGNGSAAEFDRELAPGRFVYPPQAQQAMMNLLDSHDTVRFRTQAGGDARKLRLATLFQMTYVGAPHIYYGNEIAMEGGSDPDCRRPFPWDWVEQPERRETLEWFRQLAEIRKASEALRRGTFKTLLAEGPIYAFSRQLGDEVAVVVMNNSDRDVEVTVSMGDLASGSGGVTPLLGGGPVSLSEGVAEVSLGPFSGTIFRPTR